MHTSPDTTNRCTRPIGDHILSYANLSILAKVSWLLVLLGVGALAGGGYAAYRMICIDASYSQLLNGRSAASISFARANRSASDWSTSLYWNAASTTDEGSQAAATAGDQALANFDKYIQQAETAVPERKDDIATIADAIHKLATGVCGEVGRLAMSKDAGDTAKALTLLDKECHPQIVCHAEESHRNQ